MKIAALAAALALLSALPAAAATYVVDPARSSVGFSGTNSGEAFTGTFKSWTADIVFDPADLAGSHLKVVFDTASATTGNAMYDGTLPQADWFAVKDYPTASFTSTAITANADGSYTATGKLQIRNVTNEVSFPFTLSLPANGPAEAKASLNLNRVAYGIGVQSDPAGGWVGPYIAVTIDVVATPKP
ncbi:YceI family protein [Zavarzinia aquatilis]|nr:YceI family protein [Zavarzinia aquatilis]